MNDGRSVVGLYPPRLDQGASGGAVKHLQEWLIKQEVAVRDLKADGDYTKGPKGRTVLSVKRLQRAVGMRTRKDVDGNLGPKTRAKVLRNWGFDFDTVPLEAMEEGERVTVNWNSEDRNCPAWPPSAASATTENASENLVVAAIENGVSEAGAPATGVAQ